ncbi:hypothetical protein FCR2A7T_28590 [Flavobacterium cauense R2A-7]|uniref:Carboxypeptidase-like protein n=1 Tax=Flavobacterium cauense R2A-7 TaxID=1341154 RepID=V6RWZ3_9FLAO|nr:hypothetical protein [Flavobacterium cauense]ESU18562.1 hypothetical protein FCR2A7T_28590 [Flavobacterium cauense R2A-7]KGO80654.1 hypothetical protein Q762_11240 [Flavobacterium cauense R2A-7]TWI11799.1 hypothetical protein IP98_01967 [Flavobacterium cauense R2A-7]
MKRFIIFFTLFLFHSAIFGQSNLHGLVRSNGNAIANVDVVNVTKKIAKKTNDKGVFSIAAVAGDEIVFVLKDYYEKKIRVSPEQLNSNVAFELEKRGIELQELEIDKSPKINTDMSYESVKKAKLENEQSKAKVIGVYTGEIEYGVDFVEIGNKVIKFLDRQLARKFEKDAPSKGESFKNYVKREFPNDFFITKLNLKENEIDSFIDFCENDLKAKHVTDKNGVLDVLDFLIEKRKQFKN